MPLAVHRGAFLTKGTFDSDQTQFWWSLLGSGAVLVSEER